MSEKRDLWVSLVLVLAGLGLLAWNALEGRPLAAIVAALLGLGGALACLPIRVRHGQVRNVLFGMGMLMLLVPLAPGAGGSLLAVLPWIVAASALLVPLPTLPEGPRMALLGGAGLLALLAVLSLAGLLPGRLAWLFLAAAFHLALQVLNARERREALPPPGPRVCLMGGSFDPFHRGHRALAEAALRVVDRLLVTPTGQAPHKLDQGEPTSFHHRFAMARLGVEGLARVEVLQLEGRRPGPSYTVDTLEVLRRTWPDGTRFLLLLGADMLQDFPTWRDWEGILEQVTLLVARRPGYEVGLPPELENGNVELESLDAPLVDISSTAVRAAYRDGRDVEELLSPAVRAYIRDHGLYTVE